MATDEDYASLLEFRDSLRRFLHWSEQQAEAVGLTPAQHQLLLVVRATPDPGPTIGDVAEHLLLRHHSAVGLVDRSVAAGLVQRVPDPSDQRAVRLKLTRAGAARIKKLAEVHLEELRRLEPMVSRLK